MSKRTYTIWITDSNGQPVEKLIDDAMIDGLKVEYPTLNMHKEFSRMSLYFRKMTSRRWSEAGMLRGITAWLNRARAAQARITAEKRGAVIYGEGALPKLSNPGTRPPEDVKAKLAAFVAQARR